MTAIPGTNVADTIVPFDSNDTFATHDETYGKGGWRSVQNITDRDAITTERRKEGMVVKVLGTGQFFQLVGGTTNSNWQSLTLGTSGGITSINGISPNNNGEFTIVGSSTILISANPITNSILISGGNQIQSLKDLNDIQLSNLQAGQTLITDGVYWYNTFTSSLSGNSGLQGSINLDPNILSYTIVHSTLPSLSAGYPIVAVQAPSSGSNLLLANISNRTLSSFDVTLSQIPNASGYYLNWSLGGGGGSSLIVNEAQSVILIGGSGVGVVENPLNTYTISVTGSFGDSNLRSEVQAISAGFKTQITQISGYVQANTNSINYLYSNFIPTTTVTSISSGLQTQLNNVVHLTGDETIQGKKTFTNDLTVNGDLIVNGTQFIVNTQTVSAADNIIVLNGGELGYGVTQGFSGLEIYRGLANPYWLVYEEGRDAFVVGVTGQTQVVATRQDSPIADGLATWNNTLKRFDTINNNTYALTSTVQAISSSINSSLTSIISNDVIQSNSINTLFSTYANSSTVASISAGINTQVAQISGYIQANTNSNNTLFSTYANSTTVAAISAGLQNQLNNVKFGINGTQDCNIGQQTYYISYGTTLSGTLSPIVSLVVPTSSSDLFIQGIYNVTSTGFNVTLSNTPDTVGYKINWTVNATQSAIVNISGQDLNEKLIPIASALLPSISGANLTTITTPSGMILDSLDFAQSGMQRAFFNFPMNNNFFSGSNITLIMKMTAQSTGTASFTIVIDDLSQGDDWTSSYGNSPYSFTQTFSFANIIQDASITLTFPTYQQINGGDLITVKLVRTGGSLATDAKILSMKFKW